MRDHGHSCYVVVHTEILGKRDIAHKARDDSTANQSEHSVSLLHHTSTMVRHRSGVLVVVNRNFSIVTILTQGVG